ncbi:esterase-like activity of phytase family protein [Paractinoplanes hotanensis]|uniref:Esterase-like activity of phytase family protein n=1 Tax=Paractinoplanes hotanensis TaxID=2906497 RepID=A0ABT0YE43_9ACTN|nr:esterase-like activity of phytase family protein [Actinoplanes hotanensis]MCM4084325.1 esterase-like activity of phytase family protein [Actinoplanes hotanensis]
METSSSDLGNDSTAGYVKLEGFTDHLDKTSFEGEFVGNFSGLSRDHDGRIAGLSDRSVLYYLDPESLDPVELIKLRDELRHPLDGEAIVFDGDTMLIATERPEIFRYDLAGKLLGVLPMPEQFRVTPLGRAKINESFEGLTLFDERTLIGSMENSLLGDQDGIARFQSWERSDTDDDFKPGAQYAYRIEPGLMVSDIAATGDGRLLVIERGFDSTGNQVQLHLADLRGAADVSAVEHLEADAPVVGKQLLIDLVDLPSSGAISKQPQVNPLLGNIEAMVITDGGPSDEMRVLLATDDNGSEKQITRFYRLLVKLPE